MGERKQRGCRVAAKRDQRPALDKARAPREKPGTAQGDRVVEMAVPRSRRLRQGEIEGFLIGQEGRQEMAWKIDVVIDHQHVVEAAHVDVGEDPVHQDKLRHRGCDLQDGDPAELGTGRCRPDGDPALHDVDVGVNLREGSREMLR